MVRSPYLSAENRLADVIAAIQVLGTYKYYKCDFETWSDRISGDKTKSRHWEKVFQQHPEFFRLDAQRKRASLVWRRQHQKLFDVDQEKKISRAQFDALPSEFKAKISRVPLNSEEIQTLIDTAVNMHDHALIRQRDRRWWLPLAAAFVGSLIGGLVHLIKTPESLEDNPPSIVHQKTE